jgi:hypothetical protein
MPLSEKKQWGKEHNAVLKQLFGSGECDPQRQHDSPYMDLVYVNVNDNHVFRSVTKARFCFHFKQKAAQYMVDKALAGVQCSELFFLLLFPVSSSNQTHVALFLHIS